MHEATSRDTNTVTLINHGTMTVRLQNHGTKPVESWNHTAKIIGAWCKDSWITLQREQENKIMIQKL